MNSPGKFIAPCAACGDDNELPYLFCDRCGVPRLKLGHWRVTINITLSMLAFLGTYLLRQDIVIQSYLVWDLPVYLLYGFFFYQFLAALVIGMRRKLLLVTGWFLPFFIGAGLYNEYLNRYESSFFIKLLADIPDEYAGRYPLYFYSGLAIVLLLIFIPAYIRWGRTFGWVMAYRVVILSLLAIALAVMGSLAAAEWALRHGVLPQQNFWLDSLVRQGKPKYDRALFLFAITTGRLFLIEIFIFASIHGYAMGRHSPRMAAPAQMQNESAFVRSLVLLALAVRRVGHTIEEMVRCLIATLAQLVRDMDAVIRVFLREMAVPALALGLAFTLLGRLVTLTRAYAMENRLLDVAWILAGLFGTIACAVIFLGCKTKLRWGRIMAFFAQMTGWLLPNLLVFFLLLSFSLWASSMALSKFNLPEELPFRIGVLTKGGSALLIVLVVFVLINKRSLFRSVAEHPGGSGHAPGRPLATHAAPAKAEPITAPARNRPSPPAKPSMAGSLKLMLKGAARSVGERLNVKPPLVEQYARARDAYLEKLAQNRALLAMKGSIQAEVTSRVEAGYLSELKDLAAKRDELRFKIETKLARKIEENEDIELRIANQARKQGEYQRLLTAGAIDEPEFKRRIKELQTEIDKLNAQLEAGKQLIEFLTIKDDPETAPGNAPHVSRH